MSNARKVMAAGTSPLAVASVVTLVAVGLGVLLCAVELFYHGAPGDPQPGIFGLKSGYEPWAERVFIFLFGAIHLAVAAIITAFRRTAV